MTTPLIPPPANYDLPLSKGGDLVVNFQNVDPANPDAFVDYADGVTVTLIIDPDVSADAVVSGHDAVVRVESDVADGVKARALWRVIVSSPGDPSTEVVAANGKVARFDG